MLKKPQSKAECITYVIIALSHFSAVQLSPNFYSKCETFVVQPCSYTVRGRRFAVVIKHPDFTRFYKQKFCNMTYFSSREEAAAFSLTGFICVRISRDVMCPVFIISSFLSADSEVRGNAAFRCGHTSRKNDCCD